MTTMLDHFRMFAAYNRWANRRLYDAAATLSEADFRADRGAFFGSMKGTLNHLLVTDRIWMRRFTGEGDAPRTLDATLFEDFVPLRAARQAEDERILRHIAGLDDAALAADLRYHSISLPEPTIVQPRWQALAHFFNHQTHHRGQAHTLLTILGGRNGAPSIDLVLYQRSDEFKALA